MRAFPTLVALALGGGSAAMARDSEPPPATAVGAPVDCITTSLIDHSQVHDDRTIDFVMKTRKIYRNTLPSACPALGFDRAFAYRSIGSRLCSVDVVTVVERNGPGASCRLGKFQQITLAKAR